MTYNTPITLSVGNSVAPLVVSSAVQVANLNAQYASHLTGSNIRTFNLTKSVGATVNSYSDIGTFTSTNGAQSLRISIVADIASYSIAKVYDYVACWNQQTTWAILTPLSDTGPYSAENFQLLAQVINGALSLRIRKSAGSTNSGTYYVSIVYYGNTGATYTDLSTTGTDVTAYSIASAGVVAAVNLSAGGAGSIPYQTANGVTGFLGIGSSNTVLTSNGSAPTWSTSLSLAGDCATAGKLCSTLTTQSQLQILPAGNSAFSVYGVNGVVYLGANTYYNGTAFTQFAYGGSTNCSLLGFVPGTGAQWWASSNSAASWNVASAALLWNSAGQWAGGFASGSAGAIPYCSGSTSSAVTAVGVSNQVLLSGGSSAPTWANQSALSVGTATNVNGGTTGALLYQSASSATTSLSLGASGYVLTAGESAPQWTTPDTFVDDNTLDGIAALGSTIKAEAIWTPLFQSNTAVSMSSQQARFAAVYLNKAQTLTGVVCYLKVSGSYTGNNFNGVALYSYSGGTLTRVAVSANSASIWAASTGLLQVSFSSTYAAAKGLYFVAFLYSSSAQTTAPALGGLVTMDNSAKVTPLTTNSSKVQAVSTNSQTTLNTSYTSSTELSVTTSTVWAALY